MGSKSPHACIYKTTHSYILSYLDSLVFFHVAWTESRDSVVRVLLDSLESRRIELQPPAHESYLLRPVRFIHPQAPSLALPSIDRQPLGSDTISVVSCSCRACAGQPLAIYHSELGPLACALCVCSPIASSIAIGILIASEYNRDRRPQARRT